MGREFEKYYYQSSAGAESYSMLALITVKRTFIVIVSLEKSELPESMIALRLVLPGCAKGFNEVVNITPVSSLRPAKKRNSMSQKIIASSLNGVGLPVWTKGFLTKRIHGVLDNVYVICVSIRTGRRPGLRKNLINMM